MTLEEYDDHPTGSNVLTIMLVAGLLAVLLNVPAMIAGLREVMRASRARRQREE